jgi:hypothetical protein
VGVGCGGVGLGGVGVGGGGWGWGVGGGEKGTSPLVGWVCEWVVRGEGAAEGTLIRGLAGMLSRLGPPVPAAACQGGGICDLHSVPVKL